MTGPLSTPVTDRRGLRVLDLAECFERLRQTRVGRLGFVSDGESVMLPVNHAVVDDCVVFRTQLGSKMQVGVQVRNVAYEVDSYVDVAADGWSVLVKGTAEAVYDDADTDRYDALGLASWADETGAGQWIRIRPHEVSGRSISS